MEESNIVNQSLTHNFKFIAIALAVHYLEQKTLYAILAPKTAQDKLKEIWNIAGTRITDQLANGQKIFICVPLDKNTAHLPLEDSVLT